MLNVEIILLLIKDYSIFSLELGTLENINKLNAVSLME